LHGVGLSVHKWITGERPSTAVRLTTRVAQVAIALAITQSLVMLLWVFFRAHSFGDSMTILAGMFGSRKGPGLQSVQITALALPLTLVALDGALGRLMEARSGPVSIPRFVYGAAIGLAIALALFATVMANKPFIYFQF